MAGSLVDLAVSMFVGPVWPASLLVCLLIVYTLFAMLGLIDFGFDVPEMDLDPGIDVDLDLDVDLDGPVLDVPDLDGAPVEWDFWQGIGAASVRWTNFGRIPVIMWGGVFAVAYWAVSFLLWHGFDSSRYSPTLLPSVLLAIRNVVIGVGVTKMVTQPLVGYFVKGPAYDRRHLIGATCEVTTTEATPEFGQAKFRTQAAPLLLNIRTDGPTIPKGTEVQIISFDPKRRTYRVTLQPSENQS
ncbi:OB-fold-containig protein [Novipirellula artificiosorum]|uniref:DUF1449 domain-containing protein n=1 Tax=Novipirellula artificiosorum TaxID=2528016 RepID=A0A5C6DKH8_9BACT|nr:OB-fold-containig protein [Novipirellula artificiosorum]TWU37268.1 hypothetical protein Poly41_33970 [Novipirellula artificiosorum]